MPLACFADFKLSVNSKLKTTVHAVYLVFRHLHIPDLPKHWSLENESQKEREREPEREQERERARKRPALNHTPASTQVLFLVGCSYAKVSIAKTM